MLTILRQTIPAKGFESEVHAVWAMLGGSAVGYRFTMEGAPTICYWPFLGRAMDHNSGSEDIWLRMCSEALKGRFRYTTTNLTLTTILVRGDDVSMEVLESILLPEQKQWDERRNGLIVPVTMRPIINWLSGVKEIVDAF